MPEMQTPCDETVEATTEPGAVAGPSRAPTKRQPKRCLANPHELVEAAGDLVDSLDMDALKDGPLRSALVEAVVRAAMRSDEAHERVGKAKRGDPPFVAERLAEGVPVWRFTELPFSIGGPTFDAAEGLVAMGALVEAGTPDGTSPSGVALSGAARLAADTLRKLPRLSLEQVAERGERFAELRWRETVAERRDEPLAPPMRLAASGGRVWEAITTLGGADEAGRRFRNCLARERHAKTYHRRMLAGTLRLAVLRDARKGGAEHALVAWDPTDRMLEDLEAHDGEDAGGRFREDVRQLMARRRLRSGPLSVNLGLFPGTTRADPEPWMEGVITLPPEPERKRAKAKAKDGADKPARSRRRAYRVWSFKGRVLVEVGRHDPAYLTFTLETGETLAGQHVDGLDEATDARSDAMMDAARLALVDAARHADRLPPTVALLMALIAHEGVECERERQARTRRRRA